MRRVARRTLGIPLAFVWLLLGPWSLIAHAADWTVIFRASDPKLWNTDAGDSSTDDGYAIKLTEAPDGIHYLRLKRLDTSDAVIIPLKNVQLGRSISIESDIVWIGNSRVRGTGDAQNRLLGIARKSWPTKDQDDHLIARPRGKLDSGYRGWGFSKAASSDQSQTYSWEGEPIDKTVFEIAVTSDDTLSSDEQPLLLTSGANKPSPSTADNGAPAAQAPVGVTLSSGAAPKSISKFQTSIEALYVIEQDTGGMLGLASQFILTATPGQSADKGDIPVSFATPVGPQMHMVLDDVARAINVRYGLRGVEKVELSFEDKYTAKDGGSIGAAIGTLMYSMIQGFDIDPKLAITGDVTADAKVHRIGGVAAKLRGAADAGMSIVAVPAENYEQVQDAMVYEGPSIVTNVQVLGISNLDDAAAVARADRAGDLAKAIDLFSQVQASMQNSRDYIYTDGAITKLNQVVALAPNHYSAKLLLLVAQRKVPRLSAAASKYYTFVAVHEMWDNLAAQSQGGKTQLTQAIVDTILGKLNKVRPLSDLTVRPYIDAWIDYIQVCNDMRMGEASEGFANEKYHELMDASSKLDANRDLAEKMLQQGI